MASKIISPAPAEAPRPSVPEPIIRAAVDRTPVEIEPTEERSQSLLTLFRQLGPDAQERLLEAADREAKGHSFDELHTQLLEITSSVLCADNVLHDLQDVPDHLQAACVVLHRAAASLDALCDDLDSWHSNNVCRPKTDADREAVAAAYEAAMTPEERERYRAFAVAEAARMESDGSPKQEQEP
jgi:hypothetical protein